MIKKALTSNQCKDAALAIVLILLVVFRVTGNIALVMPAVVVLVIAMTWPTFFNPLAYVWFGLTELLSMVVAKILLTVVFFLIVTPVGLFRKIMGKDVMALKKWQQGKGSALTIREHKFSAADFSQPF